MTETNNSVDLKKKCVLRTKGGFRYLGFPTGCHVTKLFGTVLPLGFEARAQIFFSKGPKKAQKIDPNQTKKGPKKRPKMETKCSIQHTIYASIHHPTRKYTTSPHPLHQNSPELGHFEIRLDLFFFFF